MRIGNPPPTSISAFSITDLNVSNTLTTTATQTITNTNHYDIAAAATTREVQLTNKSTTGDLWVRDQAATTGGEGTLLGPRSTLFLNTRAALRVQNNSGGSIDLAINVVSEV